MLSPMCEATRDPRPRVSTAAGATYCRGMNDEPGRLDASGKVRASDAEREAAVERLREATAEGRLTFGELTKRTEAAYTATTRGELAAVTADLPAVPSSPPAPVRPAAGRDREWVVAVMGDSKRQGRWRVERPLAAVAVMGDVVLDLRGAEVPRGDVDIVATAVMGDVKVYVPDGVDVELSGVAVMGDKQLKVREAPAGQPSPRVVVRATAVMGDVKVVGDSYAEPVRRTLRAWLTRDDRDRRAIE
jgi:uncharacterized protein DUF1707/cell wall-active antibiotic response 4TMS protein YvqF